MWEFPPQPAGPLQAQKEAAAPSPLHAAYRMFPRWYVSSCTLHISAAAQEKKEQAKHTGCTQYHDNFSNVCRNREMSGTKITEFDVMFVLDA